MSSPASDSTRDSQRRRATATVLVISGDHLAWRGLRAELRAHRRLAILLETPRLDQALPVARDQQPDLVLIAADLDGAALMSLLREVRACCPQAQLILLGTPRPPVEQREWAALGVSASLTWEHLAPGVLPYVLAVVRAGLVVGDRQYVAWRPADDGQGRSLAAPEQRLPPTERTILRHLAHGATVKEIARLERLAPRQVDRNVAALKTRLSVSTLFTLALAAARRGYLDPDAVASSEPQAPVTPQRPDPAHAPGAAPGDAGAVIAVDRGHAGPRTRVPGPPAHAQAATLN